MRTPVLLILLVCTAISPAQKLTLGVVTGYSLSRDFPTRTQTFPGGMIDDGQTTTSRFFIRPVGRTPIIGPKLELSFTPSFGLEVDALYRPIRSEFTITTLYSGGTSIGFTDQQTHVKWEFPILAKYRIPRNNFSPFFSAGALLLPVASGVNLSHLGFVSGAGVEMKAGPIVLSPGLRYKRLAPRSGRTTDVALNHFDFTVGVHPAQSPAGAIGAFGRRIHLGILAGFVPGDDIRLPVSPFFQPSISDQNSAIFGAVIEFEATRTWAVEGNGIYRPLHATDISQREGRDVRWAVLTWEFPVLLKYKFRPDHRVRPFAALGPSFRLDGNFNGPTPAHYGVTASTGVEIKAGFARISPTVRYTRWAQERGRRSPFRPSTFLNEAQILAAFTF